MHRLRSHACYAGFGAESSALGLCGAHSASAGMGSRGQQCPPSLTQGQAGGQAAPLISSVSPPGLQSWKTPSEGKKKKAQGAGCWGNPISKIVQLGS